MSSSDAPAQWWDYLNVTYAEFSPRVYTASSAVKANHDLMSNYRDTQFDLNNSNYVQGVLILGAIFVVVGISMLLMLPVTYCCIAKVKCCCRSLKHSNPKDSRMKWMFVVASLLSVTGAALTITGFVQADKALDSASGNAGSIGNTLDEAAALISQVLDTTNNTVAALQTFQQSAIDCSKVADVAARFNISLLPNSTINLVSSAFDDIYAKLDDVSIENQVTDLANNAYSVQTTINDTKAARRTVILIVVVANLFVFCVFVLLGWVNFFRDGFKTPRMAKCSRWLACLGSPIAMAVIFGALIITAGSIMLATVSGDFCVDPNENTLTIVNNSTLVDFYLFCKDTPNALPYLVYNVRLVVATALTVMGKALDAAFNTDSCMYQDGALTTFSNAMYGTWVTLEELQLGTACEVINTIYADISYDTFCTQVSKSMRLLVIGSVILGISHFFVVLLHRLVAEQHKNADLLSQKELLAEEEEGSGEIPGGAGGSKRVFLASDGTTGVSDASHVEGKDAHDGLVHAY